LGNVLYFPNYFPTLHFCKIIPFILFFQFLFYDKFNFSVKQSGKNQNFVVYCYTIFCFVHKIVNTEMLKNIKRILLLLYFWAKKQNNSAEEDIFGDLNRRIRFECRIIEACRK